MCRRAEGAPRGTHRAGYPRRRRRGARAGGRRRAAGRRRARRGVRSRARPPGRAAAMCGRAADIAHHVPFTPLVHDRSNCSSGMSSSGARAPKPCALLTSTSTLPQRRTVSATTRSTSSRRPTSATSASASPPAARISCAVRSARCSFSSATHTRAPARANRSAIPRPMPWPAPVTSAALPASRSIECAGLVAPALRARHRGASGVRCRVPLHSASCADKRPSGVGRRARATGSGAPSSWCGGSWSRACTDRRRAP